MTEERKREIEKRLTEIGDEMAELSVELGYVIDIAAHPDNSRALFAHVYDGCVIRCFDWEGALSASFEEAWEYLDEHESKKAWKKWFGGEANDSDVRTVTEG